MKKMTPVELVIYVGIAITIIAACIGFLRPTSAKYERCKQSCLQAGASTWNYSGRYGCSCGGDAK